MLESLVAPLLKQITDLLGKELGLASAAKSELEYLNDLIRALGSLLKKASSKEAMDEEFRASMKRVRKFLYDSQDAIDDLMLRESNRKWEGLASYFYDHYTRRTFATEADYIQKMLEKYRTILETTAAMETSYQLSSDHPKSGSACQQLSPIAFSEERDDELVGIGRAKEQLVQWLTENSSMSKVIFVHGAQGVGKTSLVGAVLRDQKVRSHFRYYVWIKDVRSCEMVEDKAAVLMKANAEMWDLTKKSNRAIQVELNEVFKRMRNNKYRWTLVLDDTGREHVFECLWSHLDQTRPSVLVTTRVSSLASTSRAFLDSLGVQSGGAPPDPPKYLYGFYNFRDVFYSLAPIFRAFLDFLWAQSGSAPPEHPKHLYGFHNFKHVFLSMDDSCTLFCRKIFHKDTCPPVLKDVSNSILEKCGGLPLAILATYKLLIGIQDGVNGTPQAIQWQKLSGRLGEELLSKGDTSGIIRRMITLRMDHLNDVHDCLFYLSIFPLDCPISCSTLMRLWMAERLIEQKGTKPIQTIAMETLKKLADHNLIQEVEKTSYGRLRTCHIHNVLHQIIIFKSKDDEFAMIVTDQEEGWPENIWRLSFHSQMDSIKDHMSVKRLRSLLVFKKVHPKSMKSLLRRVIRLRVLDLQASSLNSFPKEILNLKHLRYLNLRGTNLSKIPDGIGNLAHLETLDLKDTFVPELPNGILKLKVLSHLLVYRSNRSPAAGTPPKYGFKAPSRLGVLTSLRKLCLIELNQVKQSTLWGIFQNERVLLLEELRKLVNLQRLGISNLRNEDVLLLCSSIEKLTKLEALHLIADTGEILDLSQIDKSKAPPFLQRVHLTGRLRFFPKWILSPTSLAKLVLKGSQLNEDSLQHLRELQCLKHLELQQTFDVCEMMFKAGSFQQLCFLGLDIFDNLESIQVEEEALPNLERLSLARCRSLTIVPQVITRPRKLKCLELYDMPKEFMTAVEGEEVCEHMKVQLKVWKDGAIEEVVNSLTDHARSFLLPSICKK